MQRPTTATAISIVALFFSLGGVSLAASKYVITSTSQIKPSVLNALRGKRGTRGPQGPGGAAGLPGATGAPGSFNPASVVTVQGPDVAMCVFGGGTCAVGDSVAVCPAGDTILGGGWSSVTSPPLDASVGFNQALGGDEWQVIMTNNDATQAPDMYAIAVCAS